MSTIHMPARLGTGTASRKPSWWSRFTKRFSPIDSRDAAEAEPTVASESRAATRFLISQRYDHRWSVETSGRAAGAGFTLLSQAVAYARSACDAAPATIELRIGDVVAVIHQTAGWPKSICGEAIKRR